MTKRRARYRLPLPLQGPLLHRASPIPPPRQPMPAPRHPPPRHPPPRQASAELVSIGTAAVISAAVKAVVRSSFMMPSCTRRLSDGDVTAIQNEQFVTSLDQCNGPSRSHPSRSVAPPVGRLSVRHRRRFPAWQAFQHVRRPCPETRTDSCLPTI